MKATVYFPGVTTVLTMTFLGLEARTDLPQVAYPTALDYFVFTSFMFIFSTSVQVSNHVYVTNDVTQMWHHSLQFALVHYFTKLGAGEYYLEELEETVCVAEIRLKEGIMEDVYAKKDGNITELNSCSVSRKYFKRALQWWKGWLKSSPSSFVSLGRGFQLTMRSVS